jgi:hypothetical protein
MPSPKKPRKPHVARALRVPVTRALVDEFGMSMHTAIVMLERAPDEDAFNNVSYCMNVIALAASQKAALVREYGARIDSAIRALNLVGQRHEQTQRWRATELELASAKVGVLAAEELLGRLTVFELYAACQAVVGAGRRSA